MGTRRTEALDVRLHATPVTRRKCGPLPLQGPAVVGRGPASHRRGMPVRYRADVRVRSRLTMPPPRAHAAAAVPSAEPRWRSAAGPRPLRRVATAAHAARAAPSRGRANAAAINRRRTHDPAAAAAVRHEPPPARVRAAVRGCTASRPSPVPPPKGAPSRPSPPSLLRTAPLLGRGCGGREGSEMAARRPPRASVPNQWAGARVLPTPPPPPSHRLPRRLSWLVSSRGSKIANGSERGGATDSLRHSRGSPHTNLPSTRSQGFPVARRRRASYRLGAQGQRNRCRRYERVPRPRASCRPAYIPQCFGWARWTSG